MSNMRTHCSLIPSARQAPSKSKGHPEPCEYMPERNEYIFFLLTPMFLPLAIWTIETRHLIKLEPEFPPRDPIQRELKDTCLQPARGTICLLERRDFTQCQRLVRPSSMQENRAEAVMYQLWTRLHLDYDYLIMHISYSLLKFYPHTKTLKMNLVGRGIV